MVITLTILIILYIFYRKKLNKLISNLNKIYYCFKILLIFIPIIILYFNKDMVDKVMEYLGYFDKTGLYNSRKDLSFHLKKLNNTFNINKKIKVEKRNVSESKKKYIASNQNWTCGKCKQMLDATYEVDHIVPLYKGGSNNINNLMAMCRNCHGNKTLQDRIN